MLRNYFKAALGNLVKNKLFSAINFAGLAVGLAACILIALYVQEETSYDKHWRNAASLFQLSLTFDTTGNSSAVGYGAVSPRTLPALQRFFPGEIERAARVIGRVNDVYIGDRVFNDPMPRVDRALIDMFEFEVLAGSLETALADPGRIALSEELARRFFGGENPLGRVLSVDDFDAGEVRDYIVEAVYRLPAGNTVLELPAMMLLDENDYTWATSFAFISRTYLQLAPGADAARMNARLDEFSDQYFDISVLKAGPDVRPSERVRFKLQQLSEVYLNPPSTLVPGSGSKAAVLAFSGIAVLVLLIACINFTVLSTAKATQRAREVAVRKVSGASRGQLVLQYLSESFFIVLPALLLGLMLAELTLPPFESLVRRELAIPWFAPGTWLALLALLLAVGLMGGLYPALILSHFRPAAILKANKSVESGASLRFRSALVVFQFSITIALMIATAVIYLQLRYSINRDPGFDRENVVVIRRLGDRSVVNERKDVLKERIAALPGVASVGMSGHAPMQRWDLQVTYSLAGEGGDMVNLPTLSVDQGFFGTYRIPLLAGRTFEETRDRPGAFFGPSGPEPGSSRQDNVVINAAAARTLGFADPAEAIGRQLRYTYSQETTNDTTLTLTIIGVVGDTQFFGLRSEPRPELYHYTPYGVYADALSVRFQGSPAEALAGIRETWEEVMGGAELFFDFVDQLMLAEFQRERSEARMLVSFSALAILIACLGLFGSAAFNMERRTKEIGIRKVMGAEVREIVTLLLWQFSRPVMLANVIAWPAALWAMLNWLQRFPYSIDAWLLLPLCASAGLLALLIAWVTVGGTAAKVASRKPVLALRYE